MNFVAHARVARLVGPDDPELALGATLPDLSAMSGLVLDRDRLAPGLLRGMAFHQRTDRRFHADLRFRTGSAELRCRLARAGLPAGAVRAVGHAGWELLLDGCLLERPGVSEELASALSGAPGVAVALADRDQAGRWQALAASLLGEHWWMGYRSPALVAERLFRRLGGRPRLAFGPDHLSQVTRALAAARPGVERVADEVVGSVAAGLAQS